MTVQVNVSALAKTKWYEYGVRFLFGGLITATAGIIAKAFGPEIGGLFLAFPAIFPASATSIEKHEVQRTERVGIGSIGLAVFAVLVWRAIPNHPAWLVLTCATLEWGVSVLLWELRKRW